MKLRQGNENLQNPEGRKGGRKKGRQRGAVGTLVEYEDEWFVLTSLGSRPHSAVPAQSWHPLLPLLIPVLKVTSVTKGNGPALDLYEGQSKADLQLQWVSLAFEPSSLSPMKIISERVTSSKYFGCELILRKF